MLCFNGWSQAWTDYNSCCSIIFRNNFSISVLELIEPNSNKLSMILVFVLIYKYNYCGGNLSFQFENYSWEKLCFFLSLLVSGFAYWGKEEAVQKWLKSMSTGYIWFASILRVGFEPLSHTFSYASVQSSLLQLQPLSVSLASEQDG